MGWQAADAIPEHQAKNVGCPFINFRNLFLPSIFVVAFDFIVNDTAHGLVLRNKYTHSCMATILLVDAFHELPGLQLFRTNLRHTWQGLQPL